GRSLAQSLSCGGVTMLLLVRHATTGETTRTLPTAGGRAGEDPGARLDARGRADAAGLRGHLPTADTVWSSHARRAVDTALLALRAPDEQLDALAEADFGAWAGRELAAVHTEDPMAAAAWMTDPRSAPPGGESFTLLRARARRLLGRAAQADTTIAAFTHGGFIRAAVTTVLRAPSRAAWAVTVPPASVTVLTIRDDVWQIGALGWRPTLVVS
ncbi:MAG TPA: histidine phosphatase family protein, partial [Euzebya sp.]|nr:histidine phosphatase family protein [Euzebya sp.]